ncbi:helix-hairpin-helix domain-containing protein [Algoriphagus namhaensis]
MNLELTDKERAQLRKHKIKKSQILGFASDELAVLLDIPDLRAKEIYALADFQRIPSIGLEFAKDLIFLGFYRVHELKGNSGAHLTDLYEKKKGYRIDPCVEDQFRLAVDFAEKADFSKKWWDFTQERKAYRSKSGYPADRPTKNWTEV